ncbi:MAG: transglutaminase domain-containing protein [Bacillota bacterium]
MNLLLLVGLGYAALVALTRCLLLAMGHGHSWPVLLGVALGQCLLAAGLAFRTRHTAVFLGILAAMVATLGVHAGVRRVVAGAGSWVRSAVAALTEWMQGIPPVLTPDLVWAGAILPPLLVAVVVLAFCARRRDPFWPLATGALIPVLGWFSFFDRGLDYLCVYIVLAMGWLAAWRNLTPARSGPGLSERLTGVRAAAWAVLVTSLVLVAARGLPSYPVVSPGRLAERLLEAVPGLGRLRGTSAAGPVGFNPNARHLGGAVSSGTGVALHVLISRAQVQPGSARVPLPRRLYLRGTVESLYAGKGWRDSAERFAMPRDSNSTDWMRRLGEVPSAFWLDVELEVRRHLPYLYLFAPWIPVQVGSETFATADMELTSSRPKGSYTVRARVPLHSAAELNRPGQEDSPRWGMYLQLPPSVPSEVAELARRVTAGADTAFEKAKAIEYYLRVTYPYDTEVPRPARGEDFVADFLFDLKRGYCVHHSTAMAVMLRTLGVPTRWVQGFVIDLDTGRWIEVPSSSAHAWVEVYIPDCGWVTFDPTPRYPVPEREYVPAPVITVPERDTPDRPWSRPGAFPGRWGLEEEPGQPPVTSPASGGSGVPWLKAVAAVVLLGAAAPGGRLAYRLAWLWRQHRPLAGESPRAFVLRQYRLMEYYLALAGVVRQSWQTPREFLREFAPRLEGEVRAALSHLTAAVEEAAYGPRPQPAAADHADLVWEVRVVGAWVRRKLGPWQWLRWLTFVSSHPRS